MEKKFKILHLATDEKFIKAADWLYDQVFPNQNTFIITVSDAGMKLKHIERKPNYFFYVDNKDSLKKVLTEINNYDIVILHGLDYFKSRLVLKANNKIKFVWILWGYEIYSNPYIFGKKIFGKSTYDKFVKRRFSHIKNLFRPYYYLLIHKKPDHFNSIIKASKRITALSILHKEDYDLFLAKNIITPDTKYFKFTYYPIEFIFGENKDWFVNGKNILLGNSASYTNNHLEAFDILKKLDLNGHKIITPLSYGNKFYGDKIAEIGEANFGTSFIALRDFLPLIKYNKLIQSCGIVVMNHYRQQAVGNILASLWMGAKIYLDERNTFYHYLKRIGITVFSINRDLKPENKNVFELLSDKIRLQNRRILKEEISADNVLPILKENLLKIMSK